jgi:ABC-type amino acid transport substrate-binding protein
MRTSRSIHAKPTKLFAAFCGAALILAAGCSSSGTSKAAAGPPATLAPLPTASGPSGAPASAPAGCPVAQQPAGAAATQITSWVDPRPCDWAQSFPNFAPPQTGDGSLAAVQKNGVLTICAEEDIKPIVYRDPATGTTTGFEVDIVNDVAKTLGIGSIKYIDIPFASYIPALQAHKCDIVMGGIAITSQRAQAPAIRYAGPYFRYADVVVVKKSSPYQSVNDLAGKSFASVAGSVEDTEIKNYQKTLGDGTKVREYTQISSTYLAVANGTDDALVDGNATWPLHPQASQLRALPGLVAPPEDANSPYFSGSGAIITAKSANDLNVGIAVALGQLVKDGTINSVLAKWNLSDPNATTFVRPGIS